MENKQALDEAVKILYSKMKDTVFVTIESPEMKPKLCHYKAMKEKLGEAKSTDYQKSFKKVNSQNIQAIL